MESAKRGQDTEKPRNFKQMVNLPPNQRTRAQGRSLYVAPENKEHEYTQGWVAGEETGVTRLMSHSWQTEFWRLAKEATGWVGKRKHPEWLRSWQTRASKWLHVPQWKKHGDNLNMTILKLHSWAPPVLSHPHTSHPAQQFGKPFLLAGYTQYVGLP